MAKVVVQAAYRGDLSLAAPAAHFQTLANVLKKGRCEALSDDCLVPEILVQLGQTSRETTFLARLGSRIDRGDEGPRETVSDGFFVPELLVQPSDSVCDFAPFLVRIGSDGLVEQSLCQSGPCLRRLGIFCVQLLKAVDGLRNLVTICVPDGRVVKIRGQLATF